MASDPALVLTELGDIVTPVRVFQIVSVLALAWFASTMLGTALSRMAEKWPAKRLKILRIVPVARITIWTTAIWLILFPILNPEPQAVTALLGAFAIAAGLAVQDTLKNMIGGFTLLFDRPFQVGDKVQVGEHFGEVVQIGLRSVRLITNDDNLVTLPSAFFSTQSISNANAGAPDFQVVVDIFVEQDVNTEVLDRLGWEAAVSSPYVYLQKPVAVRISEIIGDRVFTRIRVKAYVIDVRLEVAFHSDVSKRLKTALREVARA